MILKTIYRILSAWNRHRTLIGSMWQEVYAIGLAEKVNARADRTGEYSGSLLYAELPTDMASALTQVTYDPYNKFYDKHDLYRWISEHVFFDDDGNIVGFFGNGELLICREGYEEIVGRFARAKNKDIDG